MSNALVFSGGGVSGVAWQAGVLRGLADEHPQLAELLREPGTTFVGTSAGAVVASQFAGGASVDELYELQLNDDAAVGASIDFGALAGSAQQLLAGATTIDDVRTRIGDLVRGGFAAVPGDRRTVLGERMLVTEWPEARLLITAVDAETERPHVFDAGSGADLVDAVTASCAVPLVWPAVQIDGRLYVDGGVASSTNAQLAAGAERVLVLAASGSGAGATPAEIAALRPADVTTIFADEASRAAFGGNSLDAATRRPAAEAGRRQGRRLASAVDDFWRGAAPHSTTELR